MSLERLGELLVTALVAGLVGYLVAAIKIGGRVLRIELSRAEEAKAAAKREQHEDAQLDMLDRRTSLTLRIVSNIARHMKLDNREIDDMVIRALTDQED